VSATWTVEDRNGEMLPHFIATSRLEVARKIMGDYYDYFRLHVSSSYREIFDRDLRNVLERKGWQIVPVRSPNLTHQANQEAA
jgi:hypothetical protein